jgi:hypothetical protein
MTNIIPVNPEWNTGAFSLILFRQSTELLRASDQPIAKVSTYTQHGKTMTNNNALSGVRNHDPSK